MCRAWTRGRWCWGRPWRTGGTPASSPGTARLKLFRVIVLSRFSGNYGSEWQEAGVEVEEVVGRWVVWVEGRVGTSYLSDIGLDTIAVLQGERWDRLFWFPVYQL